MYRLLLVLLIGVWLVGCSPVSSGDNVDVPRYNVAFRVGFGYCGSADIYCNQTDSTLAAEVMTTKQLNTNTYTSIEVLPKTMIVCYVSTTSSPSNIIRRDTVHIVSDSTIYIGK